MFYSNKDLKKLIIPLVIEQILIMAVGMVDTMMISSVGEAAVSGVSLVDTLNILIINVFGALATGGAVVAGHFLGQKNEKDACKAAWQLILFSGCVSVVVSAVFIGMHNFLLQNIFGKIDADVMGHAKSYLIITAISIVPLAVYNGCAALFRAMGNSKITMWICFLMNIINVVGNAVLIYGCKMGTAGAAIATTFSRIVAAIVLFLLLYKEHNVIHFKGYFTYRPNFMLIKKILYVGIPNGLENSMFQLGKILLLSLVSTFGTFAIAANAVCNTVAMFNVLPGVAIGYAQLSVISYCIGAGDEKQAKYYTKKLMLIANICMTILSVCVLVGADYILRLYQLTPQTAELTAKILRYHAVMAIFFWVPSFSFSNTFRGAGDVVYPMTIAIISMWVFRIGAAYIFSNYFHMGLMGVWIAMTVDWLFRAVCFAFRYRNGKWLKKSTKIALTK